MDIEAAVDTELIMNDTDSSSDDVSSASLGNSLVRFSRVFPY